MTTICNRLHVIILLTFTLFLFCTSQTFSQKHAMTWEEMLKFKALRSPSISYDGKWVACSEEPDRGDPRAIIKSTELDSVYYVQRGVRPQFSKNNAWVALTIQPKKMETENLEKGKDAPKTGMVLLSTVNGSQISFDNIEKYVISNDSRWIAYKVFAEGKIDPKEKKIIGSDLILRHLESGSELTFPYTSEFAFDSTGEFLTFVTAEPKGEKNSISVLALKMGNMLPVKVQAKAGANFTCPNWSHISKNLAYIYSDKTRNDEPDSCSLYIWNASTKELSKVLSAESWTPGWFMPFKNKLQWSNDGKRLFYGIKPLCDSSLADDKIKFNDSTFFDLSTILKKTESDIWHWNDPRIKPNQKNWWKNNKDSNYLVLYNLETRKHIQLGDSICPDVDIPFSLVYASGTSNIPYLKNLTWDGDYRDLYCINISDGTKKLVRKKLSDHYYISPNGNYIAYFFDKHWYLYNCKLDTTYNYTQYINYPLWDEDNDVPDNPPSYGFGGWLENDEAFFVYDRYDIWKVYITGDCINITAADGRKNKISFHFKKIDPEKRYYTKKEEVLLESVYEKTKEISVSVCNTEILGTDTYLHDAKEYTLISKAKNAQKYLYSRQAHDEFPDLWVADSLFKQPKKITNFNDQLKEMFVGKNRINRLGEL